MKDEDRRSSARGVCLHKLILASVLAGCSACANSRVVSDDKEPVNSDGRDGIASKTPEIARPGLEHERLQALIGNWKAETRAWRRPDAPVEEGKGTMSNFWMLDGLFVGQEYKSRAQRPKYQGLGALGYDSIRKVYTSVWLDTASTSIYTAIGSCDVSGNVFTLEGGCQDPVTGKPVKCRSITRIVDSKKYTFELFQEGSDGKVFKTLDISYTRE